MYYKESLTTNLEILMRNPEQTFTMEVQIWPEDLVTSIKVVTEVLGPCAWNDENDERHSRNQQQNHECVSDNTGRLQFQENKNDHSCELRTEVAELTHRNPGTHL